MSVFEYLLKPEVFLVILLGLAFVSLCLIRIFIQQDKKMRELEQDAALSSQMYSGLKSQYDEMEKALLNQAEEERQGQ